MFKALALSIWFALHPVHVTLTSIDHVPGTDSLKVFFRMYFDDFLRDYKLYDAATDLENLPQGKPFPADLMNRYFNDKVNIYINNKLLNGKLLSMKLADNEISLNLLYCSARKPKKITVRNLVSTDLYSDQANMTIIRINKFEEGIKLTVDNNEHTLSLK